MLSRVKRVSREFLNSRHVRTDIEALRDSIAFAHGSMHAAINRSRLISNINDAEFSAFSQWGEDGIIQFLIGQVPIQNPTFIEFGSGAFTEANCRFLLQHDYWSGFVIDCLRANIDQITQAPGFWKYDLRAACAFITRDNVQTLADSSGFGRDLGILSIDIDGNDYWIAE